MMSKPSITCMVSEGERSLTECKDWVTTLMYSENKFQPDMALGFSFSFSFSFSCQSAFVYVRRHTYTHVIFSTLIPYMYMREFRHLFSLIPRLLLTHLIKPSPPHLPKHHSLHIASALSMRANLKASTTSS